MRDNDSNISPLQVSDLTLATTLILHGFIIERMNLENPSRATFEFKKTKDIQDIIEKFWRGDITVEPRKFNYTLRELKARIRNEGYENKERK